MIKRISVILILLALQFKVVAQDIHFSQFITYPFSINPASVGAFEGAYRFGGIYRRQWRSVTIPYNTVGLSADMRQIGYNENFALGANFYYDQAGDSHYSLLQANIAGAWSIPFDRKRRRSLNIGVQANFTQRTIDYSKLKFDSQYRPGEFGGYYDPSAPDFESFNGYSISYPDVNAGIYYNWRPKKRKRISAGLSVYNITRPRQSFMDDKEARLDPRINIHADALFQVSYKVDVLPQILLMNQGTFYQATIGMMGKYTINSNIYHHRAVYAGVYTRARDAAFVTIGMDYNEVYFGLSYDINYSRLVPASQARGGWEFAVVYVIGKMPDRRKYRACPDFM